MVNWTSGYDLLGDL